MTSNKPGISSFSKELTKYFMDFLDSDFKNKSNYRRYYLSEYNYDTDFLQTCIDLDKYKDYASLIRKNLINDHDNGVTIDIQQGTHIKSTTLFEFLKTKISSLYKKDLYVILEEQIKIHTHNRVTDIKKTIELLLDSVASAIKKEIIDPFVESIKSPLHRVQFSVDIEQITAKATDLLICYIRAAVCANVNNIFQEESRNITDILHQELPVSELQEKLEELFKQYTVTKDLFFEILELIRSRNSTGNYEYYLCLCDITYAKRTFPLLYLPIQIEDKPGKFCITYDPVIYVYKKIIQEILQGIYGGQQPLSINRMLQLNGINETLIKDINSFFKDLTSKCKIEGTINIEESAPQIVKGQLIQITNRCYIALFDKSNESIVNDYEEILHRLNNNDDQLIGAFQGVVNDFINNNPVSSVEAVEQDWERKSHSEKLTAACPVPLNEEQQQILLAINREHCKYITIEGPPGTGKSHTITAIICNAILNNQSILVLSDKKEALDVVEDKLTGTLNKFKVNNEVMTPILRIGKIGNSYSKILSTDSIASIKDNQKIIRSEHRTKTLKDTINEHITDLKIKSKNPYQEISLLDIQECLDLETKLVANPDLDLAGLDNICFDIDQIVPLRKKLLAASQLNLDSYEIFQRYCIAIQDIGNYSHFMSFLEIIEKLRSKAQEDLPHLSKIELLSSNDLETLRSYVGECRAIQSQFLGYGAFLKKSEIVKLGNQLSAQIKHNLKIPLHTQLDIIERILSIFEEAQRRRHGLKFLHESHFFKEDFIKTIFDFLRTEIVIPNQVERDLIFDSILAFESITKEHPNFSLILGCKSNDLSSLFNNKLLQCSEEYFQLLVRYLQLKRKIQDQFLRMPEFNYSYERNRIERLVTRQMVYSMNERIVQFLENHRNDATTLSGIIRRKQKLDLSSLTKLKNAFPCILSGIRDFAEYIPLECHVFDLVVIDEASQVSIAQALPALLRSKKVIILGDKKQFQNIKAAAASSGTNNNYLNTLHTAFVTNISSEALKLERLKKFNIKTSVLEFFEGISNYNIMLRKHLRSYQEHISYSNKYFYEDRLQAIKIRTKGVKDIIRFTLIEHDGHSEKSENINLLEIDAILTEVKCIMKEEINISIGIITPHTDQQNKLEEVFCRDPDFDLLSKQYKLKIMTFDTCQGEERDIIIYSMVANLVEDKLNKIFGVGSDNQEINLHQQRLNVGFSRAKERIHFFISKPIDKFEGRIGEALRHYQQIIENNQLLSGENSLNTQSAMEQKVLSWIQETDFFKQNRKSLELRAQFPIGKYLKQLDRLYSHPLYVIDFLLVYVHTNKRSYNILIEYDGFEFHFNHHHLVQESNYEQYYTDEHIYRQKVLEGYGYNFLRINRFNIGQDPILTLNNRLNSLVQQITLVA